MFDFPPSDLDALTQTLDESLHPTAPEAEISGPNVFFTKKTEPANRRKTKN